MTATVETLITDLISYRWEQYRLCLHKKNDVSSMNAELLLLHINRQFILTNSSQAGRGRGGSVNAGSAETEKENKEKH